MTWLSLLEQWYIQVVGAQKTAGEKARRDGDGIDIEVASVATGEDEISPKGVFSEKSRIEQIWNESKEEPAER